MNARVETNSLIAAVKQNPVIWDRSLEAYKAKKATANAWNEVCSTVNADFKDMNMKEKNRYVTVVMKRWKNIRDGWVKARKRISSGQKSESTATVKKSFLYDGQLLFLNKLIENPHGECLETESSSGHDHDAFSAKPSPASSIEITPTEEECKAEMKGNNPVPKMKARKVDIREHIPFASSEGFPSQENRHFSFFKGIIPSLNKLDEEEVLEFQAGVINILQTLIKKRPLSQR
ncbi:uncharacterized protein LOC101853937 [Aplysia californica]|uniref:Uncharacterized protein LOC101853937 n=1 Tax=Aplysia californica TaxID=6500 RepID=A0ABM0JP81_APLCA|nr:uncharacterized protein LOC101853937 [Aplysia californica]